MPQKCETPCKGRESPNSCRGWSRLPLGAPSLQTLFVINPHRVSLEMAAILAALASRGSSHG